MPFFPRFGQRQLDAPDNAVHAFMCDFLSAWGFRAVTIAFRRGVFAALRESPRSPAELATIVGFDPTGTELLLDALENLGYVTLSDGDGRYRNTPVTERLLVVVAGGVPYFEKIVFQDWETLDGRLRGDVGLPFDREEPRAPLWMAEGRRVFQNGMVALANMNLDEVLRLVRIPASAHHLLDLGGGHGLYSVAFCQRHPQLTATVFDIPSMRHIAEQVVSERDLADRIRYRAGDFFVDDLEPSSVVLLFNVIHSKTEAQNQKLLERVVSSLEPGGMVVLLDQFPSRHLGRIGRSFGTLMALSMFNSNGQRTYPVDQVRDWFGAAGLRRIGFHPVRSAPGNALLIGHKPR